MTIIRAILSGMQSINKIRATLQIADQAVTKKWFVKINLSW